MKNVILLLISLFMAITSYSQKANEVEIFELFERDIQIPQGTENLNPFNPDAIELICVLQSPTGKTYTINGFYYEDYYFVNTPNQTQQNNYPNIQGQELFSNNKFIWKIRFTPKEIGTWKYHYKFYYNNSYHNYTFGSFDCVANSGDINTEGFLSFDNQKGFYKQNGDLFTSMGLNCGAYPNEGENVGGVFIPYPRVNFIEKLMEQLAENGGNYLRLWIDNYRAIRFVGKVNMVYKYDRFALNHAYELDEVIEAADKHNIRLQLVLFTANSMVGNYWGWKNPYNRDSDPLTPPGFNGPCEDQSEFFTLDETLVDIDSTIGNQKNMIKYIIDRYGYSPQIASWELFNEVNQAYESETGNNIQTSPDIIDWHEEMYDYIKSIDIHNRPITTSFAGNQLSDTRQILGYDYNTEVFNIMDFTQSHIYGLQWHQDYNMISNLFNQTTIYTSTINKPTQVGEALSLGSGQCDNIGLKHYSETDPHGIGIHNEIWSSLFNKTLGPPLFWEWFQFLDRDNPNTAASELMIHFRPVSEFVKNVLPNDRHEFTANQHLEGDDYIITYLSSRENDRIYGHILNDDLRLDNLVDLEPKAPCTTIEHPYLASLDARDYPGYSGKKDFNLDLKAGRYKISWFDPSNSNKIRDEYLFLEADGNVELYFPNEFYTSVYGDIAFSIEPTEDIGNNLLVSGSTMNVLDNTLIFENEKIDNDKVFYVESNGAIKHCWKHSSGSWYNNDLADNAPLVKNSYNTAYGIEVNQDSQNKILYTSADENIYRIYWDNDWYYSPTVNNGHVSLSSDLHYRNGKLFYQRYDGKMMYISGSGNNWSQGWISGAAPISLASAGFSVDPNSSEVYYLSGIGGEFIRLYWDQYGWHDEVFYSSPNIHPESKIQFRSGRLFYVANDNSNFGRIRHVYESGGRIVENVVDEYSTNVGEGTGFEVDTESSDIFYIDENHNIVKLYWTGDHWATTKLYISGSISGGARFNSDLAFADGVVYYVGMDEKIYVINYQQESKTLKMENNKLNTEESLSLVQDGLSVYPNPASNYLKININNLFDANSLVNVSLFDINGKAVFSDEYHSNSEILHVGVENLQQGFYMLRVFDIDNMNKVYNEKIIIK